MVAYTQTRRAEDKHTDRQTSADDTESFLLCRHLPASQQGPGFTLDFLSRHLPDSQQGLGFTLDFLSRHLPDSQQGWGFTLDFLSRHLPASQQGPGFTLDFLSRHLLLHSRAPDLHWTLPVLSETMLAHTQTRKAKDKHRDS